MRMRCLDRSLSMLCVLIGCVGAHAQTADIRRGERVYLGEADVSGHMVGHTTNLPRMALKCVNCHAKDASVQKDKTGFAPPLSGAHLLHEKSRRGGPPSKYDLPGFCKLLREGIDPAFVVIDNAMPRYKLSLVDCESLWLYVKQLK